jgi:hypothetical protein
MNLDPGFWSDVQIRCGVDKKMQPKLVKVVTQFRLSLGISFALYYRKLPTADPKDQ